MPRIIRDPALFASRQYDLIIVGGGIYGTFLALQSALRRLRPLMLERDDFGGKTSFNSHRIIHGGLRYLQSADLRRFKESVQERRWFSANFSDLVSPLACLMPLYGRGVRRNSIMRAALLANDLLSSTRNKDVPNTNHIRAARVIGASQALEHFPMIRQENLTGGALWHDAAIDDSQRIIMELLRWAVDSGANTLNYMRVTNLARKSGRVHGVEACDSNDGREYRFHAPVIINSAGPWVDEVIAGFGAKQNNLFTPSLAWNLWIDKPAPTHCAVALTPERKNAPTYFLRPWKGRMLLGTGHSTWTGELNNPQPSRCQIDMMLEDIHSAAPALEITHQDIRHVFAGLLPTRKGKSGKLAVRPKFVDHNRDSGLNGVFSSCGVKFTTARRVAIDTLTRIFGREDSAPISRRPNPAIGWRSENLDIDDFNSRTCFIAEIKNLVSDESVEHLTDLVLRRTDLWENPVALQRLLPELFTLFDWDQDQMDTELQQLSIECGIPFNSRSERHTIA